MSKTFLFYGLTRGGIIRNPGTSLLQFSGNDLTREKLKMIRKGEFPETRGFEDDS